MATLSSENLLKELSKPFNDNEIDWRVQTVSKSNNGGGYKALVLPYIQSRAVMDRLDAVCGVFWKSEYQQMEINGTQAFQCSISIFADEQWITRTDGAAVTDIESIKGGYSDSLKRAAVQWGIGRFLYNLPKYWVDIKDRGDIRIFGDFKVNGQKTRITGYFDRPKLNLNGGSQPSNNSNRNTQSKSNNRTPQGANRNQNPSTNKNQNRRDSSNEQRRNAITLVQKELKLFNLPTEHVNGLLKRVGINSRLEAASMEEINKVYAVVHPVVTYMKTARNMGYSKAKALQFVSEKLRERISIPANLFFKLNGELCDIFLQELYNQTNNGNIA